MSCSSTLKFMLGACMSVSAATPYLVLVDRAIPSVEASDPPSSAPDDLSDDGPPADGWFGNCLQCKWDPWGGPAFCAVATGKGFWGCYATGYKCQAGGGACGKATTVPGVK